MQTASHIEMMREAVWLSGWRRLADSRRFVVYLERDLLELVGVLFAVVGAEEKLEPAGHSDAYVCLRPAPIAAIGGVQGGAVDD
jgi:hypothetical protein